LNSFCHGPCCHGQRFSHLCWHPLLYSDSVWTFMSYVDSFMIYRLHPICMIREKRKKKGKEWNKTRKLLWWRKFFCERAWVRVQRVLPSPYQICLVVVVLYNIHELDKSVHLKAFSLKITFQGYVQAQSKENWLLWIHTYLWVSL
jgi:hypothetical protein